MSTVNYPLCKDTLTQLQSIPGRLIDMLEPIWTKMYAAEISGHHDEDVVDFLYCTLRPAYHAFGVDTCQYLQQMSKPTAGSCLAIVIIIFASNLVKSRSQTTIPELTLVQDCAHLAAPGIDDRMRCPRYPAIAHEI
jgi:hypothetical protein